jgi:hypothetical protein
MIEVRFMKLATDRQTTAVAAVLVVLDDGSHTFTGELPATILDAPILDRTHPQGRILFNDDPLAWANNCHKAFRGPYLRVDISNQAENPQLRRSDTPPDLIG